MKTVSVTKDQAERGWWVVDLEGARVGRAAAEIAAILRGKHKPTFTPNADTGDFVIVVNAEKVEFSGAKWDRKLYRRHSGYPGGIKEIRAREVLERHPERIITEAVKGMLPKSSLGRDMIKKLKVYTGPEHPHEAQQPKTLELNANK